MKRVHQDELISFDNISCSNMNKTSNNNPFQSQIYKNKNDENVENKSEGENNLFFFVGTDNKGMINTSTSKTRFNKNNPFNIYTNKNNPFLYTQNKNLIKHHPNKHNNNKLYNTHTHHNNAIKQNNDKSTEDIKFNTHNTLNCDDKKIEQPKISHNNNLFYTNNNMFNNNTFNTSPVLQHGKSIQTSQMGGYSDNQNKPVRFVFNIGEGANFVFNFQK
eukprot:TRINITY_DN205_c1_g1_i1.p1 TRINITY_DN205_c1_g1~~TRINITY_DN205_c1_g1_i1.p1  ORF type:complete len:218 (+),score=50.82 TRINITY_DN205_c1_g1_i1:17-670(+)